MKKILQVFALVVFIFYCLNANLYKRGTKSSKLTYIIKDGNRFRVYKSDSTLFSGLEIKDFGINKIPQLSSRKLIKPEFPKNEISAEQRPSCNLCNNSPNNGSIRRFARVEIPYKGGLINGLMKSYLSDGSFYINSNYINGNRDGIESRWNREWLTNKAEAKMSWQPFYRVDAKYVNGYKVKFSTGHFDLCYDEKKNKIPCYRK